MPSDNYLKYRRKLSLLTETFKTFHAEMKTYISYSRRKRNNGVNRVRTAMTASAETNNLTQLHNLRDEYGKIERKQRTVENMGNMAPGGKLSKENDGSIFNHRKYSH